jgi:hypothetical protein
MDLLARKRSVGVSDARLNIGWLEKGVFGEEFFRSVTRCQHAQYMLNCDTQTADNRLAAKMA